MEKVYIVGIGDDGVAGLSHLANSVLEKAELLIGSVQALAGLPESKAQRFVVRDDFDQVVKLINDNPDRRIVFLVTGDPLFYGTTRLLYDQVGKDRFEILPHVSIMQLAFARVKENWDEAILADLSAKPLGQMIDRIRSAEKVGLFTGKDSTPAVIARTLLDQQLDYFTAYVCENLGSPYERVTQAELRDLVDHEFQRVERDDPGAEAGSRRSTGQATGVPFIRKPGRLLSPVKAQAGLADSRGNPFGGNCRVGFVQGFDRLGCRCGERQLGHRGGANRFGRKSVCVGDGCGRLQFDQGKRRAIWRGI